MQAGGRAAAAPRAGGRLESLLKAPQAPPERCPSSSGLACWVSPLCKECWPGRLERELTGSPATAGRAGTSAAFCPDAIFGVSWSCTVHLWLIIRISYTDGQICFETEFSWSLVQPTRPDKKGSGLGLWCKRVSSSRIRRSGVGILGKGCPGTFPLVTGGQ